MINPHIDQGRVVWDDSYRGEYRPVDYSVQFDDQWRLFLEKKIGFHRHNGVETSDPWIDGRIYELTGARDFLARRKYGPILPAVRMLRRLRGIGARELGIGGRLYLDPKFDVDYFRGKRCLDIGCGAGRWTRTLLSLGASVKSVDISPHAIQSTRRFNDDVEQLDLFDIPERKDLHEAFDFVLCWGVVMCTHDPAQAFENVAKTVRPGGDLYSMTYAPTLHASPSVLEPRRHYHRNLESLEEKLKYAYEIADSPENAINIFDMLNTFYNWVVPEEVIHGWYRQRGFSEVITLNRNEVPKCAYHVLGKLKQLAP